MGEYSWHKCWCKVNVTPWQQCGNKIFRMIYDIGFRISMIIGKLGTWFGKGDMVNWSMVLAIWKFGSGESGFPRQRWQRYTGPAKHPVPWVLVQGEARWKSPCEWMTIKILNLNKDHKVGLFTFICRNKKITRRNKKYLQEPIKCWFCGPGNSKLEENISLNFFESTNEWMK